MSDFYYVYTLVSESDKKQRYTGLTVDLPARLNAHNAGNVAITAQARPWVIETAIAFNSREKAAAFEKYLKTPEGRAFASKHL